MADVHRRLLIDISSGTIKLRPTVTVDKSRPVIRAEQECPEFLTKLSTTSACASPCHASTVSSGASPSDEAILANKVTLVNSHLADNVSGSAPLGTQRTLSVPVPPPPPPIQGLALNPDVAQPGRRYQADFSALRTGRVWKRPSEGDGFTRPVVDLDTLLADIRNLGGRRSLKPTPTDDRSQPAIAKLLETESVNISNREVTIESRVPQSSEHELQQISGDTAVNISSIQELTVACEKINSQHLSPNNIELNKQNDEFKNIRPKYQHTEISTNNAESHGVSSTASPVHHDSGLVIDSPETISSGLPPANSDEDYCTPPSGSIASLNMFSTASEASSPPENIPTNDDSGRDSAPLMSLSLIHTVVRESGEFILVKEREADSCSIKSFSTTTESGDSCYSELTGNSTELTSSAASSASFYEPPSEASNEHSMETFRYTNSTDQVPLNSGKRVFGKIPDDLKLKFCGGSTTPKFATPKFNKIANDLESRLINDNTSETFKKHCTSDKNSRDNTIFNGDGRRGNITIRKIPINNDSAVNLNNSKIDTETDTPANAENFQSILATMRSYQDEVRQASAVPAGRPSRAVSCHSLVSSKKSEQAPQTPKIEQTTDTEPFDFQGVLRKLSGEDDTNEKGVTKNVSNQIGQSKNLSAGNSSNEESHNPDATVSFRENRAKFRTMETKSRTHSMLNQSSVGRGTSVERNVARLQGGPGRMSCGQSPVRIIYSAEASTGYFTKGSRTSVSEIAKSKFEPKQNVSRPGRSKISETRALFESRAKDKELPARFKKWGTLGSNVGSSSLARHNSPLGTMKSATSCHNIVAQSIEDSSSGPRGGQHRLLLDYRSRPNDGTFEEEQDETDSPRPKLTEIRSRFETLATRRGCQASDGNSQHGRTIARDTSYSTVTLNRFNKAKSHRDNEDRKECSSGNNQNGSIEETESQAEISQPPSNNDECIFGRSAAETPCHISGTIFCGNTNIPIETSCNSPSDIKSKWSENNTYCNELNNTAVSDDRQTPTTDIATSINNNVTGCITINHGVNSTDINGSTDTHNEINNKFIESKNTSTKSFKIMSRYTFMDDDVTDSDEQLNGGEIPTNASAQAEELANMCESETMENEKRSESDSGGKVIEDGKNKQIGEEIENTEYEYMTNERAPMEHYESNTTVSKDVLTSTTYTLKYDNDESEEEVCVANGTADMKIDNNNSSTSENNSEDNSEIIVKNDTRDADKDSGDTSLESGNMKDKFICQISVTSMNQLSTCKIMSKSELNGSNAKLANDSDDLHISTTVVNGSCPNEYENDSEDSISEKSIDNNLSTNDDMQLVKFVNDKTEKSESQQQEPSIESNVNVSSEISHSNTDERKTSSQSLFEFDIDASETAIL